MNLSSQNDAVSVELKALSTQTIVALRDRYRGLFGREPPKAFGPDLLRRSIAQKIQEDAYGGLKPNEARQLAKLVAQYRKNPGAFKPPRRVKAGTVLVRQWQGKSHRVTVLADGFCYDGRQFASLSQVACHITGTHWSGPRFFGLDVKVK